MMRPARPRQPKQSMPFAAGLTKAASMIAELREDFWKNVRVLGSNEEFNQSLEKAGRVADFFELGELMCIDALNRNESCGGHFREEYQTPEGEALRDDANYSYVAAWGFQGEGRAASLTKEPLALGAEPRVRGRRSTWSRRPLQEEPGRHRVSEKLQPARLQRRRRDARASQRRYGPYVSASPR